MTARTEKIARLAALAEIAAARALIPVTVAQNDLAVQKRMIAEQALHRRKFSTDGADPVLAARIGQQAARLREAQASANALLAQKQAALDLATAAARPLLARKALLARLRDEGALGR